VKKPSSLSLQRELDEATAQMEVMLPKETITAFEQSIQALRVTSSTTGLSIGTKAPDFTLRSQNGNSITLSEETSKGPVILLFYRGIWCPFCNIALRAYQQALKHIEDAGAQLFAVSPQTLVHSTLMQEKNELNFPVLSDPGNQIATKYNLVFRLPDSTHELYRSLEISLDVFNDDSSWELPIPATYIIDSSGIIRLAHVNPDYKKRLEPSEVINLLSLL